MNRRIFIKRTALAGTVISSASILSAPYIMSGAEATRKLNCVLIGCGGRAMNHLEWLATTSKDNILAIVDPDEKQHAKVKRYLQSHDCDADKVETFTDYRVMYDKLGKQLDAVVVATPNHHHALASMLAMNLEKAVYCEKPLTHDIGEARRMREMAAKSKAPTQMGNQGHCEDGYRSLCELVWAGVVGKITETHSWTNRANGGAGPRPPTIPPPNGMHWNEWIGPAPYRDFHTDLHPHEWHGWYDFGNGSIGNMGCHVLDGVYWALKLEHPTSVEMEEVREGTEERYPTGSRVRWDFPARDDMPPVKVYWYEGLRKDTTAGAAGNLRVAEGEARNLPPLYKEMLKKYPDEEFDSSGTLYVGEKGIVYTATYGGKMHILPLEKFQQMTAPPKVLPRTKNIMRDFLDAIREGKKETAASFDYGSRLTEFTLLANLAQHAGVGKKIQWDGAKMKVTNHSELNQMLQRPYRKGWTA